LKVSIRTDDGLVLGAGQRLASRLERGPSCWASSAESGCGKSTLIRAGHGHPAACRPMWTPVKSCSRCENLLVFSETELNQRIRGGRIGFIPQDPLLSLNPVFRSAPSCWRSCATTPSATEQPMWRHLVALLRRLAAGAGARGGAGALPAPVLRRSAAAVADRRWHWHAHPAW